MAEVKREPNEVCDQCFGTYFIPGKGPCPCRAAINEAKRLTRAKIPPRYQSCTLETFKAPKNGPLQNAFMYSCKFVLEYPTQRGLLLAGPVGTGKTHLAVSIITRLIKTKQVNCLFYEFGSLLKEIQDSYNPSTQSSELRVLAPIYETELLVLDELGASVPSEWVRDIMYQIVNRRYNDRKPTIFTTNYLDDSSKAVKAQTLEERIGPRLRSRLHEMTHYIEMSGDDYRKKLARKGFELAQPNSVRNT